MHLSSIKAMVGICHFCTLSKESFLPACIDVSRGMARSTMEELKKHSDIFEFNCTEEGKGQLVNVKGHPVFYSLKLLL